MHNKISRVSEIFSLDLMFQGNIYLNLEFSGENSPGILLGDSITCIVLPDINFMMYGNFSQV